MSLLGTMNVGFWLVPFRALFQLDQAETVSKYPSIVLQAIVACRLRAVAEMHCRARTSVFSQPIRWQRRQGTKNARSRPKVSCSFPSQQREAFPPHRLDLDRRLKKERVKTKRRFCKPMRTTNNRRGGCHKQKSQPTTAGKERNQRMEKTARLPCQSRFTAPVGIQVSRNCRRFQNR
jgi:hypothetical protein